MRSLRYFHALRESTNHSSPPLKPKLSICDHIQGHGKHDSGGVAEGIGDLDRALRALSRLDQQNCVPSTSVYISLLQKCSRAKRKAHTHVTCVHTHLSRHDVQITGLLGDHLVVALANCGALDAAYHVFLSLTHRTVFSWTAMITAYTDCGRGLEALHMRHQMRQDGVEPNEFTFVSLLKACATVSSLEEAQNLHADMWRNGFGSDVYIRSTLVTVYGKCGSIAEAEKVFEEFSQRNIVTWNSMITAYVEQEKGRKALLLYRQMQEEGIHFNRQTILVVVRAYAAFVENEGIACAEGLSTIPLELGRSLHADARKNGYIADLAIGVALVSMYGKCNGILEAENVFDAICQQNVVSWTAMITAYVLQNQGGKALQLYRQMQEEGVNPNLQTYVVSLQACEKGDAAVEGCRRISFQIAQTVHEDLQRACFASNPFIGNTLVNIYGNFGNILEAEHVFNDLSWRDSVSWGAMMSAYLKQGHGMQALQLYRQMLEEGFAPIRQTCIVACQVCETLAENEEVVSEEDQQTKSMALEIGQALHVDASRIGFMSDIFVCSTVVNMYCKCGCISEAEVVFNDLSQRDVILWNAMLSIYYQRGLGRATLQLYRQMQEEGLSPNQQTYVVVLQACNAQLLWEEGSFWGGLSTKEIALEIGRVLHIASQKAGISSDCFVCSALVSMYGKCGSIVEAENVFSTALQWDVVLWNAMFSAYVEQGQGEKALKLYRQMQEEGVASNPQTDAILIQACTSLIEKSKESDGVIGMTYYGIGQALQADAWKKVSGQDAFLQNTLMNFYCKCCSTIDAENVFHRSVQRNILLWNGIASTYVSQGQARKALCLYRQMQEEGVSPNCQTYVIALQACGALADEEEPVIDQGVSIKRECLEIGKALHADAQRKTFMTNSFISNTLVSMYGKCGSILEAEHTFQCIKERNIVSYNVMILVYVSQGQGVKALHLYRQMQREGLTMDHQTVVNTLQACAVSAEMEEGVLETEKYLEIGKALHADACRKGFNENKFVINSLVSVYGKCGSIVEAEHLFDDFAKRNIVTWNALISAYVRQGQMTKALQMFRQMQEEGYDPNRQTYVIVLQACCDLAENKGNIAKEEAHREELGLKIGEALHVEAQRKFFTSDIFIGSTLMNLYAKCGQIFEAEGVFVKLSQHDLVLWNMLLSLYTEQGYQEKALQLYRQMRMEGMTPNRQTFMTALQACSSLSGKEVEGEIATKLMALEVGEAFHADALWIGLTYDHLFSNSLLSMYGKFGSVIKAENVFNKSYLKDNVVWSTMISIYADHGQEKKALHLYRQMQEEGINVSRRTLLIAVQVCSTLMERDPCADVEHLTKLVFFEIIQAFHVDAHKNGFAVDEFVGSTLITLYGKCGSIVEAENVFEGLPQRDVVCWSAMITAYAEHGQGERALQLYVQMHEQNVTLDEVTMIGVLQACSETGCLEICQQLHFIIISADFDLHSLLMSSLICAYANCASMPEARAVFDRLPQPDAVSWNTCIAGHAQEGCSAASMQTFEEMQKAGIVPDEITFLSLLTAFDHAGLLEMGVSIFVSMATIYGLTPKLKHYIVILDLLGRAGDFKRVEFILSRIPMQSDPAIWLCLLGVCRTHNNVELGKQAFDCAMALETKEAAAYILMSNIYADTGSVYSHSVQMSGR